MSIVIHSLLVWFCLGAVGLLLMTFRRDAKMLFDELAIMLQQKFPYWLISFFVIFLFLPLTIPYSIKKIGKWKR